MTDLLSSFKLKGFEIKNRLVVPPMVCFDYSDNGYAGEKHVRHYDRLASGGSGIVIVESTCVNENGRLHKSQLGIWDDTFIPGLSDIAKTIHDHSAIALIQLHFAGLRTSIITDDFLLAPSDYECENGNKARTATDKEIEMLVNEFYNAAVRAKLAGFDGVELHAAHGYLISQFLSPVTNRRSDEYGRVREKLAVDIIERIQRNIGNDFIISVRMGGNDPDVKTCVGYAKAFEKAGADILHVSTGFKDYKPNDLYYEENEYFNWIVRNGIVIRRNVHIPVIVVNGINTLKQAEYIINEQLTDFVAVGRGILSDEGWINKYNDRASIVECRKCKRCHWFSNASGCPNYKE